MGAERKLEFSFNKNIPEVEISKNRKIEKIKKKEDETACLVMARWNG